MNLSLVLLFNFISFFPPAISNIPASIYDFKVAAADGSTIDFASFKGKMILVVNTPTEADYDPEYKELNELYKKYHDKLVIVGFLADDFGIEPGTKLGRYTGDRNYNVSFPLAAKVQIKGDDRAPIYHWLTEKQYNNLRDSEVKWNFQKYLIDEKGVLIAVFDPKVKPADPKIIAAIENR